MKKKLIFFERITFLESQNKKCNILKLPEKEKKELYSGLKKEGFYNGEVKVIENYFLKKNILNLVLGKADFYYTLLSEKVNQKPLPILAVNAVIEVEDSLIFIRRGNNVYLCQNKVDFPAGLVPWNESPLQRLKNRLKEDLKLNEKEFEIKGLVPCAILVNAYTLNLFFKVKYKGTKEKLNNFFNKNFNSSKPFLVEKSKLNNFFKKNDKPVFSEILKFF